MTVAPAEPANHGLRPQPTHRLDRPALWPPPVAVPAHPVTCDAAARRAAGGHDTEEPATLLLLVEAVTTRA
jgi:hypothetical protein